MRRNIAHGNEDNDACWTWGIACRTCTALQNLYRFGALFEGEMGTLDMEVHGDRGPFLLICDTLETLFQETRGALQWYW